MELSRGKLLMIEGGKYFSNTMINAFVNKETFDV